MSNKSKLLLALFVIVLITIVGFLSTVNYKSRVVMGGKTFNVDIADTSFTQARGLSFRESLKSDEGMFFVFKKDDKHGFWMKDMNFPIDIIWLDRNFIIKHIEHTVDPTSYPKIFIPEEDTRYVLEVKAGEAKRLGIKLGDSITFYK